MSDDSILGVKVGDTATFTGMVKDHDMIAMFGLAAADATQKHSDSGMLNFGLIQMAVQGELAQGASVTWRSQSLRFIRPVRTGDEVTARVEVTRVDVNEGTVWCSTHCTNQAGAELLIGEATLHLRAGPGTG
jgi:acyl dehydratase